MVETCTYLWFLALLEERLLALLALRTLLSHKVLWAGHFVQDRSIDAADVYFRSCSDHISCVHPSKRYAVDLEWACNQEGTLVEVLEEDDSLSSESTSEENEDRARL